MQSLTITLYSLRKSLSTKQVISSASSYSVRMLHGCIMAVSSTGRQWSQKAPTGSTRSFCFCIDHGFVSALGRRGAERRWTRQPHYTRFACDFLDLCNLFHLHRANLDKVTLDIALTTHQAASRAVFCCSDTAARCTIRPRVEHCRVLYPDGVCYKFCRSFACNSSTCRQRNWLTGSGAYHQQVSPASLLSLAYHDLTHGYLRRTKRYKILSVVAAGICIASSVVILLRWRGQISFWESLEIFPPSVGVGLLSSSQFIGVSSAVEKGDLATTISMFFLSGQIGMMIGASGSAALVRYGFRDALMSSLRNQPDRDHVCRH